MRTSTPRPSKPRRVQAPKRREPARSRPSFVLIAFAAAGIVALTVTLFQLRGESGRGPSASTGLPSTPDYHSLLVDRDDASGIRLGTHAGLYRSLDGGHTWRATGLEGRDAMNLASAGSSTVWVAGHEVLARSTDGGRTWQGVSPSGLPSLDVHGFAVDPNDPRTLYAAIAGQGLFRSRDGGRTFAQLSEVGGAVMALAVLPGGRILAGDMQQGLLASEDGRTWRRVARVGVMGLAVNPSEPRRVLATGPGILLSTDGGARWRQVFRLDAGTGPVAWSASDPRVAYVVGFDRVLYRSNDAGATWRAVVAEGGAK